MRSGSSITIVSVISRVNLAGSRPLSWSALRTPLHELRLGELQGGEVHTHPERGAALT